MRKFAVFVVALAAVLGVVGVVGVASPAGAGGANLHPVQDRYEPGDIATYVGYAVATSTGGWVNDGPYVTFAVTPIGARLPLGQVHFEPSPIGPRVLRVSVAFPVPDDLAPGHYELVTCNAGCSRGLGDLAGGTLHVSVDPLQTIYREWPPDEPEIANLPEGAVVMMPAVGEPPAAVTVTATATATASATSPGPIGLPTTTAAPPAPVRGPSGGHEASPAALVLGGVIAAVCVGLVLVALREG